MTEPLYGLLAEFKDGEALVATARRLRQAGYRRLDAFTPYPVDDLAEALGRRASWVPFLALGGGLAGAAAGFLLQYWVAVIQYPLNVGGRPLNSWPAFVPITFETAILGAAVAAVVGMLALNGLPQPYHPVFNVPDFGFAAGDRFFLVVEARDEHFDTERTALLLLGLGAMEVQHVPV